MKKLSKAKLKQIARLSIAIHAHDFAGGFTAQQVGITDEEFETLSGEFQKAAERLAGRHPMNFGSVENLVIEELI